MQANIFLPSTVYSMSAHMGAQSPMALLLPTPLNNNFCFTKRLINNLIKNWNFQLEYRDHSTRIKVLKQVGVVHDSVETGSGHPGQPGLIFSGSSGSDPVYKLSGSDRDWIT